MSGLVHGTIFGVVFFLIYILPWSLIIFGLYRWRRWQRFRTPWMLAPSIFILAFIVGSLLVDPPNPTDRFKRFAKTNLPTNAENLHFHFRGGGIADIGDTYYFTTSASEVDRLIADLGLSEDVKGVVNSLIKPLPDCPDFSSWEASEYFSGEDERQHWFYYLITDSTRTHVYVMVGCI